MEAEVPEDADPAEAPDRTGDFRGPTQEAPVFSRTVDAVVGQAVEIPFYGNDWVFLGEASGLPGIAFNGRRTDPAGQTFRFVAEAGGDFSLRFFRQDFLRDRILNDYVMVRVGTGPSSGTQVVAERWPSAVQEARVLREAARIFGDTQVPVPDVPPAPELARIETAVPDTGSVVPRVEPPVPQVEPAVSQFEPAVPQVEPSDPRVEPVVPPAGPAADPRNELPVPQIEEPDPGLPRSPFDLLSMAGTAFGAGDQLRAIALLDSFRELYPAGSDEAWWLYGQILEAAGPGRNVAAALDFYRRLVGEFPQSGRLSAARERIAFIERFFINIR